MSAFSASPFRENGRFRGYPPPPTPSESRDWRGVCKNRLQNLEPQGFRGQNLENKGVRALLAGFCVHRLRLDDHLLFEFQGQGQMSHSVVEKGLNLEMHRR